MTTAASSKIYFSLSNLKQIDQLKLLTNTARKKKVFNNSKKKEFVFYVRLANTVPQLHLSNENVQIKLFDRKTEK
jgi:hypothetical protein